MIKYLLVFLFNYVAFACNGQSKINGVVKDATGNVIFGATIHILDQKQIKFYTLSDGGGKFSLNYNSPKDTVTIEISHIGYQSTTLAISKKTNDITIFLNETIIKLPEIVVKSQPISQKGDTISYTISSFSEQNDRVIGDVIRKLPGIQVSPNGQISYNGKAISNYYIEGLDLLEGKYNLANNNISIGTVDKVQILENHQALKILEGFNVSNSPALNIKLKENAKNKLYVTLEIGSGIDTAFRYLANLNLYKFSKKQQFISGLKTNNSGDDYTNDITEHYTIDNIDQIRRTEIKQDLLFVQKPTDPSIPKNNYTGNNSNFLFLNGLHKTSNYSNVKYSISILKDKQSIMSESLSKYFIQNDTISIVETQAYSNKNLFIKGDIKYIINKQNLYLSNKTFFNRLETNELGQLKKGGNLTQNLNSNYQQLSNELMFYKKVKHKLVQFNSYLSYKRFPAVLIIYPGVYDSVFNNNSPYHSISQNVTTSNFNSSQNLSFKTTYLKFVQKLSLGINYQKTSLESELTKNTNNGNSAFSDSFSNNIFRNNLNFEIKPEFSYNRAKINISLLLPVNIYYIKLQNTLTPKTSKQNDLLFNPSLSLGKKIGNSFNVNININYVQAYAEIIQQHSGFILASYRNLQSTESNFPIEKQFVVSALTSYKNLPKAIFSYFGTTFTNNVNSNALTQEYFNTLLVNRLSQRRIALNTYYSVFHFSKYYSKYKINTIASLSTTRFKSNIISKSISIPISNSSTTLLFKISKKIKKIIFFEYSYQFINSSSKVGVSELKTQNNQQINNIKVQGFINEKLSSAINMAIYKNTALSKTTYPLLEANIAYKIKKIEINFTVANITNTKYFFWNTISDNINAATTYKLRPINFFIKCAFNL